MAAKNIRHNSRFRIPATVFVEEVKKVVHGWDITIMPSDFTKNPELYDTVTITASNQDTGVTRKACLHLKYTLSPPSHYALLVSNIGSLVCRGTKESEIDLCQKIYNQFTVFFDRK